MDTLSQDGHHSGGIQRRNLEAHHSTLTQSSLGFPQKMKATVMEYLCTDVVSDVSLSLYFLPLPPVYVSKRNEIIFNEPPRNVLFPVT